MLAPGKNKGFGFRVYELLAQREPGNKEKSPNLPYNPNP